MSPPTEKRYPVSDGIHHPPLVSDGDSQGICVKSGAVDNPGALVGSLGWERLRQSPPPGSCRNGPARDCRPCLGELKSK